jgi:hypothetical protein
MENDRLERLSALLLLNSLGGKTMAEKAMQLNIAGFSNIEIAEFLQTKPTSIATLLSKKRKNKKHN